jgi:hypothetical protein
MTLFWIVTDASVLKNKRVMFTLYVGFRLCASFSLGLYYCACTVPCSSQVIIKVIVVLQVHVWSFDGVLTCLIYSRKVPCSNSASWLTILRFRCHELSARWISHVCVSTEIGCFVFVLLVMHPIITEQYVSCVSWACSLVCGKVKSCESLTELGMSSKCHL